MSEYIRPADVGQESPQLFSYYELQQTYPNTSIPTIGDFYTSHKENPEDAESPDVVELAFYKIDYGNRPNSVPGYDVTVAGYEVKPVSDDAGGVVVIYEQTPKSFSELQQTLKSSVTQQRKMLEESGITVNGNPVQTSVEDQNRIISVIVNARRAGIETIRFKTATNEFVSITIDALEGIANAIALQVQAWFDAEEAHYTAIDNLATQEDFDGLVSYDIAANWPSSILVTPAP